MAGGPGIPSAPFPWRERYREQGFVVIRGLFDPARVVNALAAVAEVPRWIRARSGKRNVQRAQPLQTCPVIRDPSWLRSFYDNPELDRILAEILGDAIKPAPRMSRDFKLTALLVEPLERWWSTGLHRDYRDFNEDLDRDDWAARTGDLRLFNQINVPLLSDPCFWAVPGSHARADTAAEARFVAARFRYAELAESDAPAEEIQRRRAELICGLDACGAVNLRAEPGDCVLYRSNMLHCGVYEPRVRRMTLHDGVYSAAWRDYALAVARSSRN